MSKFGCMVWMLLQVSLIKAQDNCQALLWEGDTCRYRACKYLEESPHYFQLTREYHEIKDKALELCPDYALVYRHKSTAYLKTGDFIGWKKLIDKAVELDPVHNLFYRGWCRFQFFRDYEGAIADIESLDALVDYDIGYGQTGDYHLNITKGLCYKMLGDSDKALKIIRNQIEKDTSAAGFYDYLHLGVLYLETGQFEKALKAFQKQDKKYVLAETEYYRAMVLKKQKQTEACRLSLIKAKERYGKHQYMFEIYTHFVDKVYLGDIENELRKLKA